MAKKEYDQETKEAPAGNPFKSPNSTAMYVNLGSGPDGCCQVGNTESNPYGPYLPSGK